MFWVGEGTGAMSSCILTDKDIIVRHAFTMTLAIILAFAFNLPCKASEDTATISNLEWQRCSLGQKWANNSCNGEAKRLTDSEIKTAIDALNTAEQDEHHDWRLPTVLELLSLRNCSNGVNNAHEDEILGEPVKSTCNKNANKPTIDSQLFPKTPFDDVFWTSSPYTIGVWVVSFENGHAFGYFIDNRYYVRLVRSSHVAAHKAY